MSVDERRIGALAPDPGEQTPTLDRRQALKLLGGGVFVLFFVDEPLSLAQQRRRGDQYPQDFNAYLRIGEDGRVTCFTGKIEMGQGIVTSLAQMLAEELDVAVRSVDMVMGDTALCPPDSATVGSRTTKYFGPALRRAAAEARAVLLELACERLEVDLDRLVVSEGVISDRQRPKRKVTYAELARGKRIERRADGEVLLEDRARHTVCGDDTLRLDAEQKVTGAALFAGDIRVPGMVYARILRPPAQGAKLLAVDTSAAKRVEGARVVRNGDTVAVLHSKPDVADRALGLIKARFEEKAPTVTPSTLFQHLQQVAPVPETVAAHGKLIDGRELADRSFNATYLNHYVAHAPIETHTALVQVEDGEATVWASTQAPFRAVEPVAEALGLSRDKVRVITPFVGGGFGGKTWMLQVVEAARLARLARKPVMVAWTREEEFFNDSFRPAAVIKISSGLDASNKIAYWDYDNFFAGSRSSQPVYDIPHLRVLARGDTRRSVRMHPFSVGAWRGPGSNTNVFAMESQIDIMAEAAAMDPLSFRLANLENPRMKRVLEAAAARFGRELGPAPSGRGYGVVCTDYLDTYVAAAAEVDVDKATGKIRVERVVCAVDMGEVINPAGARGQVEGCVMMGLGYVLSEQLRFEGGKILDRNFDTYEIPRFSWMPEIETVLVDNDDLPPQGCGEPPITTMGAVIANAVYDATGVRMYELPMTPERVLEAMKKETSDA